MKQIGLFFASLFFLITVVHADNTINFEKILLDKTVQAKFLELKTVAEAAHIEQKNGEEKLATADFQKINTLSLQLINWIHNTYHLDVKAYKIHTYIGLNQYDSCYQYYNSYQKDAIGEDCKQFAKTFSNCKECNDYIKVMRSRANNNILHSHWWKNEEITSLVNTFKLKNGKEVYLGLEISPKA